MSDFRWSDDSEFLKHRRLYRPRIPHALQDFRHSSWQSEGAGVLRLRTHAQALNTVSNPFMDFQPLGIGVILSGGPAPGGHNVIAGIYHGMQQLGGGKLLGFLGGPSGILKNKFQLIDAALVQEYMNTGGFDMLGSGRTKLETDDQFERVAEVMKANELNALVIIGGDDSNTNAAILAHYFSEKYPELRVIGVPKTIDGDLKNQYIETSFGFDTAVRVYAELVSHIARDTLSAKKYYHFIRLMGRAASHISLEVALITRPNFCLISEEIAAKKQSLDSIVDDLCHMVMDRSRRGKNYGLVVLAEGIVEAIPEIRDLIAELNMILARYADVIQQLHTFSELAEFLSHKLSKDASYTLSGLPLDIQQQLLLERDPHGNVIVSQIEIEKLLIELMSLRLRELKALGEFEGTFGTQRHFFGYEGRCAAPTNFDADYAYSLGVNAVALIKAGLNGYMSVIHHLDKDPEDRIAMGVELRTMMSVEMRHGKPKQVIARSLVDLNGQAFGEFMRERAGNLLEDRYCFAGPIQYFGPSDLCDRIPRSLLWESDLREKIFGEKIGLHEQSQQ